MRRYARVLAKPMLAGQDLQESPTDRQEKVPGFKQEVVGKTGILCGGSGGLLAPQGTIIARKGYARLYIADPDSFTPSNYSRQHCYRKDLYKNKAVCMARNLARESVLGGEFVGLGIPLQDALLKVPQDLYSVGLCNVDNNTARVAFADAFRKMAKPAIFCGVAEDAGSGWVFVQEGRPDAACFGCAFPQKVNDAKHPCPGTPASADILATVGGFVVYALDSLIMARPRFWNLRYVFLDGSLPDTCLTVERKADCPLCGRRGVEGAQ
jgi:molybdopterin/thiamine biosynthesis adenylyltransferase